MCVTGSADRVMGCGPVSGGNTVVRLKSCSGRGEAFGNGRRSVV